MPTPDGSIIIDTRIDQKGVNAGLKGISGSLGKLLNVVKTIGKAMAAAFIGGSIINAIRGIVQSVNLMESSIGERFKPLKEAVDTLKGAFINLIVTALIPLVPYIVSAVQWLTNMLFTVTKVVAALFGMKQTVGGIATNLKKATKEAKGALAAFDQINVLQTQKPEEAESPFVTPEALAVTDDILAWVDEFLRRLENVKKIFDALFSNPLLALKLLEDAWKAFVEWVRNNLPFGDVIADVLTIVGETFKKLVINALETFLKIKENILRIFTGIKEFITGVFTGDWALAWEGLKNIVGGVFGTLAAIVEGSLNAILILLGGLKDTIGVILAPVIEFLGEMFERIKEKIVTVLDGVKVAWSTLAKWFFENVWNPIEAGFGSALTGIKQAFESTFNGIKNFIKGIVNTIIDYINGMIQGIVFGINTVIGSANAVAGLVGLPEIQSVTAPQIPRLATGAVIPPNSEFLAVLGDQRNGKNIEAPADLIRQIVREEIQGVAGDLTVTMPVYLDGEKIYQNQKKINTRHGKTLITSGAIK